MPREFYSRPKRLEKPTWPPTEPRQDSPSRNKPTHQNFQRVKSDIDRERELVCMSGQNGVQRVVKSARDWAGNDSNVIRMPEAATAPAQLDSLEKVNGSMTGEGYQLDDQR